MLRTSTSSLHGQMSRQKRGNRWWTTGSTYVLSEPEASVALTPLIFQNTFSLILSHPRSQVKKTTFFFWFLPLFSTQRSEQNQQRKHLKLQLVCQMNSTGVLDSEPLQQLEESIGLMVRMAHGQEPGEGPRKMQAGFGWKKSWLECWTLMDCWISKSALIEPLVTWNPCRFA